jgi:F-type H+-transporting ATPase subunit epsilon
MSYLKYSNLCADMVRSALKEPARAKARAREIVYFRSATWKDGKPDKQVIVDLTEGQAGKLS